MRPRSAMVVPFGPRAVRTGRVLAVLLAAGLASGPVAAEDDEVPIGTFHLNASPSSPSGGNYARPPNWNATPAARSVSPSPASEDIEELFSDALAELDAGRKERAERLFERLVAKAPESALADQARRYLAELYTASPATGHIDVPANPAQAARPVWEAAPARAERVPGPDQIDLGTAGPVGGKVEQLFVSEAGDRVFFSSGSSEIGARGRSVLASQARFIKRHPELNATIEGHADDLPLSLEQHQSLAGERAEAVRQRLIAEGIAPERISVVSWGREQRVSECPESACAAQNRRAVTVLIARGVQKQSLPLDGRRLGRIPLANAPDATN